MKRTFFLLLLGMIITSCDLFAPKSDLPEVLNIVVTELGESLRLNWDPVEGAESYQIFYTSDGSAPNTSSEKISVTDNEYIHESLQPSLTYKYLIQAVASGYNSSLSTVTSGNVPMPVFTYTGDFSEHAGMSILVRFLEVPYDPDSDEVDGSVSEIVIKSVAPDANGDIVASTAFDRTKYIGYTVAIDQDGNGMISTGDTVPGSGGTGTYSYTYWESLKNDSFDYQKDWSEYENSHIY